MVWPWTLLHPGAMCVSRSANGHPRVL